MSTNRQQVKQTGRVTRQHIPPTTFATRLTRKRKWMILGFKSAWTRNQRTDSMTALETGMQTPEWRTSLFQHLSSQDEIITIDDVCRWIEKHDWITVPGAVPRGFPTFEKTNEEIDHPRIVPQMFCPVPPASAVPAGQSNSISRTSAAPSIRFIVKRVNLNDVQFRDPFATPAERAARVSLLVESMAAVCKQVPGLKPAVEFLKVILVPMRRVWKCEMFPLNYNKAQNKMIATMKVEMAREAAANANSDSVRGEEVGERQE